MDAELHSLRIDRGLKRQDRPSGAWLSWLVLLLLAVAAGAAGVFIFRRDAAAPAGAAGSALAAPAPSSAAKAGAAGTAGAPAGEVALSATGYIVAAHRVALAPKVVGRVAWIGVEMADTVEKGQVLVRLEDDEYRARLMTAKGQLNGAKARLAELENGSRPQEVARSKAELNEAAVQLSNSEAELKRDQRLTGTGAVSDQDLDEIESQVNAQKARVDSLQQMYEMMRQGARVEQIDAQRAQVEQMQGIVASAQVELDNTVIKAPISGTILERNVEVGEYVTTGFVGDRGAKGYVVALADLHDLRVELDVSQNDFAKVSRDQPCRVTTDAYPDRKYAGVVDLIAPQANRQKATIQVKVKILNPDAYLRPDMNASVAFLSEKPAEQPASPARPEEKKPEVRQP